MQLVAVFIYRKLVFFAVESEFSVLYPVSVASYDRT